MRCLIKLCYLIVISLFLLDCAVSYSALQTGRVLDKGGVEMGGGLGIGVPITTMKKLYDQVNSFQKELKNQDPQISQKDADEFVANLATLSLFAPLPLPEFWIRYSPFDRFDFALRYGSTSLKLDGRFQLFRDFMGMSMAVGAGYNYFITSSVDALSDAIDFIGFKRGDFELNSAISLNLFDILVPYLVVRYFYMNYGIDNLKILNEELKKYDLEGQISGHAHSASLTLGFRLGYKYVYLYAELSAINSILNQNIAGRYSKIRGTLLYPAIGGLITF